MFDKSIRKHVNDFLRMFRNKKYEEIDGGILFPSANVTIQGVYGFVEDGKIVEEHPNLIVTQGFEQFISRTISGTAGNAWYMALYQNSYTPTNDLRAADFATTAGEIVSQTEGYAGATRPQWDPVIVGAQASNTSNATVFNIVTTGTVQVEGAAILSSPTRGGTDGVLLSCAKFRSPKVYDNGETVPIVYTVSLRNQ